MSIFFVVILVILFLLAISDLIVGVSNDAVNFLVSAVGSKAATWGMIMLVASLGIIFGATFSSGMMEVARKSIFNPQMFSFTEIMYVFLAVMFTDIILLDTFNTIGMPTSTTVSIVFELLGAAVSIALIKISHNTNSNLALADYINSGKALGIITGILVSVVIAFSVGLVIQVISRMIFTFKYEKVIKYFGAIWGGFAFAAITYFMIIKGAKGASFIDKSSIEWLQNNTVLVLLISFVSWTLVLQILYSLFKINILKIIVLLGTFALAMAFAGNDLVNFIGVPLAGLESFKIYHAAGGDSSILMTALNGVVKTPTLYLLIAGLIMVLTLWFSRKAKTVIKTSVNLSRQDKGYERFGSTAISRGIVRVNVQLANNVAKILPNSALNWFENRFAAVASDLEDNEKPAFDMVRASTNLIVSAILIAIGTSFKLPLSTTYVTFMVAMGTSLADGAWGRESAVYRVTGVLSVIGGWFITAMVAFTVALCFAYFISVGGIISIAIIAAFAIFLVIRTQFIHKKRQEDEKVLEAEFTSHTTKHASSISLLDEYNGKAINILNLSMELFYNTFKALKYENLKLLRKQHHIMQEIDNETKQYKTQMHDVIEQSTDSETEYVHYFVQIIDYLREISHSITFIVDPIFQHIDNNHQGISKKQYEELLFLTDELNTYIKTASEILSKYNFKRLDDLRKIQNDLLDNIAASRKQQLKRIKSKDDKLKTSLLFIDILAELKNYALFSMSLIKIEAEYVDRIEK